MKIKILGGEKEIGGNKILLEHKGTKILLDFGMSFSKFGKYFSEFLQPRKCAGLTDFFELDLLPDKKGFYRQDYLTHMDRPKESREIDAVFLSHAHADHTQFIHFLRFDIPIYSTEATKTILGCLEKTGVNQFSDFVTTCPEFKFHNKTRITRRMKDFVQNRNFNVMKPYETIKIGSLEIKMVPVDHSLPGSCGYIIYSDEGNLVYTGDIRFHGYNKNLSRKFVELAKEAKPKWLISEGTNIKDSNDGESEEGVKNTIKKLVAKASGVVFVEHPIRDIDRVRSIFEAAKENNRHLVINLKMAYMIRALGNLCPFSLNEKSIKILIPRKRWGLINKSGINSDEIEKDYKKWEREFIFKPDGNKADNAITCEDIRTNPKDYVVSMNMWEIKQIIDIRPKDAIWIKSSCEPFCDEMEFDEKRKMNWRSAGTPICSEVLLGPQGMRNCLWRFVGIASTGISFSPRQLRPGASLRLSG